MPEIQKIGMKQEMGAAVTYAPVIKGNKSVGGLIDKILVSAAVLLFLAVLATYFVEELPATVISFRSLSLEGLWLFAGGYAIGEIFKILAINRARSSETYIKTKEKTEQTLNGIPKDKISRRQEYATAYENDMYLRERKRILESGKIDEREFEEKYFSLSNKEIKERYPDNRLSKKQLRTIAQANALKRVRYNADFLKTVQQTEAYVSPTELFNARKRNVKNSVTSAIFGFVGGLFAVSFSQSLLFNFSATILLNAIIKLIVIVVMIAFRTNFGWSLVMNTELNRFKLQQLEADNFTKWCDDNPVEVNNNV